MSNPPCPLTVVVPTEHGDVFLAPGYVFAPEDVELVEGFLTNKVYGHSMPCELIQMKIDLFGHDADQIPMTDFVHGDEFNKRAFFFANNHQQYLREDQSICQTSGGYWEMVGEESEILGTNDDIIAFKKTLVFFKGKYPNGEMSNYIVEEFRLNPKVSTSDDINIKNNIENLVLCKVRFEDQYIDED